MSEVAGVVEDWSEEDQAWLGEKVPEAMRTIAVRHGRQLFTLVMQAGAANHCIGVLLANIQVREGKQMVAVLAGTMDEMCKRVLVGEGRTMEQFNECKQDVERMAELIAAKPKEGRKVSKGGDYP